MNAHSAKGPPSKESVSISIEGLTLEGDLQRPFAERGIVIFAHGSGSSRESPRNQFVGRLLREANLGTLLFDLLTPEEDLLDRNTAHLRFNIDLLARRLEDAATWLGDEVGNDIPLGFFGASTGGGAALVAASRLGDKIAAVVSRGGRPDLAGAVLGQVTIPTLLIVGARDEPVLEMNREAYLQLRCEKEIRIVPNASHLFEEPGTLDEVARLAAAWFHAHFKVK